MTTSSVPLGLGRHVEDVPLENLGQIGLRGNINGTFSIIAAALSKTSFALTLLRLMGKEKWARNFLWFAMISMNVFMFANALFQWIKCWPVSKTWNPSEPGTCWPAGIQTRYGLFAGGKGWCSDSQVTETLTDRQFLSGYSALIDIVLAFLPWKLVWSLQMKMKEKIGVAVAMSLGLL